MEGWVHSTDYPLFWQGHAGQWWGRWQGGAVIVHGGQFLALLGFPPQLCAVVREFIAWTTSACPRRCQPRPGRICRAHLAVPHIWLLLPAAGPCAGSRASGCKWSTAAAQGYCFGNLAEQCKSSKTTQGSGFGVFLLVCQQAGMCRREAAHFQGLCEQEGQLLEFEAASSTVNLFSVCYLWLGRAGEHLGYLIFCYGMFRSVSSVP